MQSHEEVYKVLEEQLVCFSIPKKNDGLILSIGPDSRSFPSRHNQ